ncbi:MAG: hypothetical protein KKA19_08980, partial [Candidatus Margulisbacteria bacterium]|nr:hypothetical protein [Candidatus Margulisiibacteriota bacterium]
SLSDKFQDAYFKNNPYYYMLIQIPLESYLDLVRHEYFGHGARAREYNIEGSYEIPFDWPLSVGGKFDSYGWTSKGDEAILLFTAGMESGTYFAYKYQKYFLKDPDFAQRHFFYYLFSKGDLVAYTYKANSEFTTTKNIDPESDIEAYYAALDAKYSWKEDVIGAYQGTHRLTYQALYSVYDLVLFSAANVWDWSWSILSGKNDYVAGIPNWKLFGQRFLPGTRVALTPWGVEYYLDMYFLQNDNSVNTFYIRQSDRYLEDFYGAGFELEKIVSAGNFSCGLGLDVFSQPLENEATTNATYYVQPSRNKQGHNIYITPAWQFIDNKDFSFALITKYAYKTEGYVMGQPLRPGSYGFLGFEFKY